MKQVWFSGAHSDVGGGYKPDNDGSLSGDTPLAWILREASGLTVEPHIKADLHQNSAASLHDSRRSLYRVRGKVYREIDHGNGPVIIHSSVKERWDVAGVRYRPKNLKKYIETVGGWERVLMEN